MWLRLWVILSVCGLGGSRRNQVLRWLGGRYGFYKLPTVAVNWQFDDPSVLHGVRVSQSFTKSVGDATLVYEFLLSGLVIDVDNNISLMDEELASMRQGKAFTAYFNDHVPKTLAAMENLLASTPAQGKTLDPLRFDTYILGAVYSAYQMKRQKSEEDQQAWGGVLARLASATLTDLRAPVISN